MSDLLRSVIKLILCEQDVELKRFKYPRTFHVPWSPGMSDDDKTHAEDIIEQMFAGKTVVVTEKLDGENTSIYSDGTCHARSLDSGHHDSRSYVKGLAHEIGCQLPKGWRLLGENLYAKHSISYDKLPDYFIVFGVVDESNVTQSWSDVKEHCSMLGLHHVPELYMGPWDPEKVQKLFPFTSSFGTSAEGYVIRDASSWPMSEFNKHVAKYVRKGHVQTDQHWKEKKVEPNTRKF